MGHFQIIPEILSQHCEEVAFLWMLRRGLLEQPDIALSDLADTDERIDAHLDGIRVAREHGWKLCKEALGEGGCGEIFTAATLALESKNKERLNLVMVMVAENPALWPGFASAFGWASPPELQGIIKACLAAESAILRRIGIVSCALHRVDPGQALAKAIEDPDAALRTRALRAVGELGRTDLLSACQAALQNKDEACRFGAAWSMTLLGRQQAAAAVLGDMAVSQSAWAGRATQILLLASDMSASHAFLQSIASNPSHQRLLVRGAGIAGDPTYMSWLIQQMQMPPLARLAGEAFTAITGIDLVLHRLETIPPADFELGPSDAAEDKNTAMDADKNLPWPDAAKIQAWWEANKQGYQSGTRYFVGEQVSIPHCRKVLRGGCQRQRIAAALYLALLQPGTPLFEWRAPAWRQQRWLAKMV